MISEELKKRFPVRNCVGIHMSDRCSKRPHPINNVSFVSFWAICAAAPTGSQVNDTVSSQVASQEQSNPYSPTIGDFRDSIRD